MTKDEAIDALDNLLGMVEDNHDTDYDEALKMAIDALKQTERKKGKWKLGYCSECDYYWGKDAPFANIPKYCPNCGAKMKNEGRDDG